MSSNRTNSISLIRKKKKNNYDMKQLLLDIDNFSPSAVELVGTDEGVLLSVD